MKTVVIYHRADFDGIFCREIAKKFLPDAELIGWDYGDPEPQVPADSNLYILDLSVDSLMGRPNLIWIDHHKTAIDKYPVTIPGYRIDGVAACRLAWQWFGVGPAEFAGTYELPAKQSYIERSVSEPLAVRLAGEYDIWDKRDPDAQLFQHGLHSQDLNENMWDLLLSGPPQEQDGKQDIGTLTVNALLDAGKAIQYAKTKENEGIITACGFTIHFEGFTLLACNAARYNSQLFTAGLKPEHDGCLGFNWDGKQWRVSLYTDKPGVDLSPVASKYGGGGHRGACGFRCATLPFRLE